MAKLNTKIVMLKGEQGKDGTNIKSVEKSASDGLTDTYTITYNDETTSTFMVPKYLNWHWNVFYKNSVVC